MSGSFQHSPADIVRQLLVDQSLASTPASGNSWPVTTGMELPSPDNAINVRDTTGVPEGNLQPTGETAIQAGVQVMLRSASFPVGWQRINSIKTAFDESIYQEIVTIDTSTYHVHAVTISSPILPLGKESPTTKRELFSLNATVSLRQTA